MKKYVIDTNALISFVTDRNKQQQAKISAIFKKAALLKVIILCPQNVVTEFIDVLDKVYGVSKTEIREMVQNFITMPGINITHDIDFKTVLSYWPETVPDYGDAIVASVCRSNKNSVIATFDKKFIKKLNVLGLSVHIF